MTEENIEATDENESGGLESEFSEIEESYDAEAPAENIDIESNINNDSENIENTLVA